MKKKSFLLYYWTFFKIGLFTIGGGYAMLPIIEKEIVEKKQWASYEEVINSYALAQSVPGVIAVNTSALLGFKLGRIKGALAFCLGVISPSIIIILVVANFYHQFSNITLVNNAFQGIRLAVIALLISIIVRMIKNYVKDWFGIILLSVTFITLLFFEISPIMIIISGGLVGIVIDYTRKRGDDLC